MEYATFISQRCSKYQNMELDGMLLMNINLYQVVYDETLIVFKIEV